METITKRRAEIKQTARKKHLTEDEVIRIYKLCYHLVIVEDVAPPEDLFSEWLNNEIEESEKECCTGYALEWSQNRHDFLLEIGNAYAKLKGK